MRAQDPIPLLRLEALVWATLIPPEQLQELSHGLSPPMLGPTSVRVSVLSNHQSDPSKTQIRTSHSPAQNLRGFHPKGSPRCPLWLMSSCEVCPVPSQT